MISTITSTVAPRNLPWSDRSRRRSRPITRGSRLPIQPDLPERHIGIAEPVDLHAPHVLLEQSLVVVVPHRNDGSVLEDHLFDAPVEIDSLLDLRSGAGADEERVDRGIAVAEQIAGTLRVEQSEEEVVGVRDVRPPGVLEHRQAALAELTRELRPWREVLELRSDPDGGQLLPDFVVLAHHVAFLGRGPDLEEGEALPVWESRLCEQRFRERRIVL